jgi:hypothetical protein
MPLQPINIRGDYQCVFGTIGPVLEEWGQEILDSIDQYWRSRATYDPGFLPRLKFEMSNTGYPHFHIGLFFTDRVYYAKFVKYVKRRLLKFDKPPGYDPAKGYSFRLFIVPLKAPDDFYGNRLVGGALMNRYLDCPTKEKDIGGGNFIVEFEDFNAYQYLKENEDSRYLKEMKVYLKKFAKVDWKKARAEEQAILDRQTDHDRKRCRYTLDCGIPQMTAIILAGQSGQKQPLFSRLLRNYKIAEKRPREEP